MLLAARKRDGPGESPRLHRPGGLDGPEHWEIREPFWSPDLYYTHECPDLFPTGDEWCLLYSTFNERLVTHHRQSPSLSGPWLAPGDDAFDTRAFYAAKTATDGDRRFLFGWLVDARGRAGRPAVAMGRRPGGPRDRLDGTGVLSSSPGQCRRTASASRSPSRLTARIGDWSIDGETWSADRPDGFSYLQVAEMTASCSIEVTISIAPAPARPV